MGSQYFVMEVPSVGLPIVSMPASIDTPFVKKDLAGGTLFVVKLDKDNMRASFRGKTGSDNTPDKKHVVALTASLKNEDKGGSVVYSLGRELKPGLYAVVMLNNQYIWPFEVHGDGAAEPPARSLFQHLTGGLR